MIIFKYPLEPTEMFLEKEVGKKRLKMLETVLRMIGNFGKEEDIQIVEEEYLEGNTIYEVRDLNGTSFRFYNFSTETAKDKCRYPKNYELEMKRKDSIISYIYNFSGLRCEVAQLNVNRICASIFPSRTLEFKNVGNHYDRIKVEEDRKSYSFLLHRDNEEEIISSLEQIILSLSEIKTLSLESILSKLQMNQNLFTIHIDIDGKQIAAISFREGKIASYSMMEENKEIQGKLEGRISRQVIEHKHEETEDLKITNEIDPLTKKQIESDIKRLLKSL